MSTDQVSRTAIGKACEEIDIELFDRAYRSSSSDSGNQEDMTAWNRVY
jgi:hypothetical protein